jgi:hypothetical protein
MGATSMRRLRALSAGAQFTLDSDMLKDAKRI